MKLDEHLLQISQIWNNKTDVNEKANTDSATVGKQNKEKMRDRGRWNVTEIKI